MTGQPIKTIITNNSTTEIGNAVQAKSNEMCKGTVTIVGDFSGGTAALVQSKDESTWFAVKDQSGSAVTLTANGSINYEVANNIKLPTFFAISLTGATTPSLTVYHEDAR